MDMHKAGKVRGSDGKCPWEGRRLAELVLLMLDLWIDHHRNATSDALEHMSAVVCKVSALPVTANPMVPKDSRTVPDGSQKR